VTVASVCEHVELIICNAACAKKQILNVLSLTVGPTSNRNDASYKPSFLTDQELKHLVLEVRQSSHLFSLFF